MSEIEEKTSAAPLEKPGDNVDAFRDHYVLAARCAIVSGAFSLIVAALLTANYLTSRVSDPLNSPRLAALTEELGKHPADAELKERIRKLDMESRRQHFQAERFMVTGSWLLVGGVTVLLMSLNFLLTFKKRLPNMKGRGLENIRLVGAMSRGAVTALAAVVISAAIVVSLKYRGELTQKTAPVPANAAPATTAKAEPAQSLPRPASQDPAMNWPRFRGPGGVGVSAFNNIPKSWDGAKLEGILWKTAVPLPGHSSPVVWGNRMFLTGATKEKSEVYCFDADTGAIVWTKAVEGVSGPPRKPPEVMEDTGYASPTAVTDGQRVCAIFATGDVVCFDFQGAQLWAERFGPLVNMYGHASSLAIHGDMVLIQLDQGSTDDGKSKIVALDIRDGSKKWESPRPVGNSWSTSIVVNTGGGRQIITSANPWVIGYNADDGSELWRAQCLSGDVAPSPAYADGLAFACQEGATLSAIRVNGQGDVTSTHLAWEASEGLPDIVSPLATGAYVFLTQTYGRVTCYDAKTGKMEGEKEFNTEFNSSPTLVGDTIYLLDKKGVMFMFEANAGMNDVGKAEIGEESTCSPAYIDGRVYIRGKRNVYCVGEKK